MLTFSSPTSSDESLKPENEVFKKVFQKHVLLLNNLEKENRPLFILFSGPPGIGKSTLAKVLEKKLSAIRISSDEARSFFKDAESTSAQNLSYSDDYALYIFNILNNTSKNHLYIFDMSCDRKYDFIKYISELYHYPLFVIRLTLPYEEIRQRIIQRETQKDNDPENYLKFLDCWYEDYQKFNEKKCDYFIDVSSNMEDMPINDLINKIYARMNLYEKEKKFP